MRGLNKTSHTSHMWPQLSIIILNLKQFFLGSYPSKVAVHSNAVVGDNSPDKTRLTSSVDVLNGSFVNRPTTGIVHLMVY